MQALQQRAGGSSSSAHCTYLQYDSLGSHQLLPFGKKVAFIPAALSMLRMGCVYMLGPSSKVMATVPGTLH